MYNIILLTLLTGNGGIASWSRKFINVFHDENFHLIPIDRAVKGRKFSDNSLWSRTKEGLIELKNIINEVKETIKSQPVSILHLTTSGSLGTFRDFTIAKLCKKKRIKCIMHCHYGCIPQDLNKKIYGSILKKTMSLFDEIWVLDSKSATALTIYDEFKEKVHIIPNFIEVKDISDPSSKDYCHIAFVGNLIPSKGIYELVEAVTLFHENIKLFIIGNGDKKVLEHIKDISKDKFNKQIKILGQLSNEKAMLIMDTMDIVALPTYYPWEAFPISILEAMSLGKLVISTPRAAIKDMLTALDGSPCGILVQEKSTEDIVRAIRWCLDHKQEADKLCNKAYEKVKKSYKTETVHNTFITHYKNLLNNELNE